MQVFSNNMLSASKAVPVDPGLLKTKKGRKRRRKVKEWRRIVTRPTISFAVTCSHQILRAVFWMDGCLTVLKRQNTHLQIHHKTCRTFLVWAMDFCQLNTVMYTNTYSIEEVRTVNTEESI